MAKLHKRTNNLAALMAEKAITETRLAQMTGLTQGHVNQIKNGHRAFPNLRTALRIARAIGVPVEAIWSLREPKNRAA